MINIFFSRLKHSTVVVLVVALVLTVAVAYAAPDNPEDILGDHPLDDHWGDVEARGGGVGIMLKAFGNGVALRAKSAEGIAVKGVIVKTTGTSYAMYASNPSSSGYGLYSYGGRIGVYGRSTVPNGDAVYAYNNATTGASWGVRAVSRSPSGIGARVSNYATTGSAYGVYASTQSGSGYAGYFIATGSSGYNYGVRGVALGTTGRGGYFHADNNSGTASIGAYGRADGSSGIGLYGYAYNSTQDTRGVLGRTLSTRGYGVVGLQSGYGMSNDFSGYRAGGFFAGDNGLVTYSNEHTGWAIGAKQDHTTGWAGLFNSDGHGVTINAGGAGKTGLRVSNGSKSALVQASDGPRLLYTEESTEVWFTDYGFGALADGAATITIDPLFASTVNLSEAYHVFVQAYGPAELYVANRSTSGFDVILLSGDPNVEFSYRIVAKRLGFEALRLESAAETEVLFEAGAMLQPGPERNIIEEPLDLEEEIEPEGIDKP